MGPGTVFCLASSGPFGSVADFQTIATGILEKYGIVARPFMIPRAFDIPSTCLDDDFGQPVHVTGVVSPERDSTLVGNMP